MLGLSALAWLVLAAGAALVGVAKTAVSGAGALAVVLFVAVLPARESTGTLLPLLLVGDLVALAVYRRHADWAVLARVLPGVVPGLLLGAWFLGVAGDGTVQLAIGVLLLVLLVGQLLAGPRLQAMAASEAGPGGAPTALALAAGVGAGFATMTANAAGPLMTGYLLLLGLPVLGFLGTVAWFFFLVNLAKLPLSSGLGLITRDGLLLDLALVPALLLGAWAGVHAIRRVDRGTFERVALAAGIMSAGVLVVTA
ncbi:sulfite exporter TauE/SafE family protein [Nocardioides sp. YIM 152588]|uniref:sulfite exporter TauE/SafE family protein n=1 Tax=Nocardioides sp. YIM 152588 TaxID=3158259 RepID=UPI0032E3B771